jgi:prevent-host-death family protein
MVTVKLDDAQSRLGELVDALRPGDEIVITRHDKPVARLTSPMSLRDIRPASVGAVLQPLLREDDLLDEMLGT